MIFQRALAVAVLVLATSVPDAVHATEAAPAADGKAAAGEAKKPVKPKPPKPDKEKNCQWDRDDALVIENKTIALPQSVLKTVLQGNPRDVDDYGLYADSSRMVLYIHSPDGSWYSANLMRIGNVEEGCVFYYLGAVTALPGDPPL